MHDDQQRLDKWLWFARIVKSRTTAARLVSEGYVRLNGVRVEQAARPVKAGDVLTVALPQITLVLEVVSPGTRRGPAEEARQLYVRQV